MTEEKGLMQSYIESKDAEIEALKTENAKLKHDNQATRAELQYFKDTYGKYEDRLSNQIFELPDEPIKTADKLIDGYGIYVPECRIKILKQIAEHLLVYVNNQGG